MNEERNKSKDWKVFGIILLICIFLGFGGYLMSDGSTSDYDNDFDWNDQDDVNSFIKFLDREERGLDGMIKE